jgi:hypothetical protein
MEPKHQKILVKRGANASTNRRKSAVYIGFTTSATCTYHSISPLKLPYTTSNYYSTTTFNHQFLTGPGHPELQLFRNFCPQLQKHQIGPQRSRRPPTTSNASPAAPLTTTLTVITSLHLTVYLHLTSPLSSKVLPGNSGAEPREKSPKNRGQKKHITRRK